MQNQPFGQLRSASTDSQDTGPSSQRRIRWLQCAVPCVLVLIGIRVAYLQAIIQENFISPWRKTVTVERIVPARNGRILARDGSVLAYDETRYDLAIEYRWLERPLDSVWLRREVSSRLGRKDRTDSKKRKTIEFEIEQEQANLFRRLAILLDVNEQVLRDRATGIQDRVERMAAAVESRRAKRSAENSPRQLKLEDGFWGAFELIKSELTTPPRRLTDDPIILKEELQPHILVNDAQLKIVAAVQSSPHAYPGVQILNRSSRIYPKGDLASHVIGVRKTNERESISTGLGGVEKIYDSQLAGKPGRIQESRSRQGDLIDEKPIEQALDGNDLVLTIDSQLQFTAEALLDRALEPIDSQSESVAKGGVIIVLDLWTGDVLAAAAAPRISLQTLANPTRDEWQTILSMPNQPFFPRAIQMALPAGSIFKIVTSAAALETGTIDANDVLHCRGFLHQPSSHRCQIFLQSGKGHGDTRVDDALCQSCNVFFFDLAEKMGPQPLLEWAQRFGFGQATGVDLPGESAGRLPEISNRSQSRGSVNSQTLQLAIGQGELLVTPLQVTRMMAAIGNGGYLVTPRIVNAINDAIEQSKLTEVADLSDETLAIVQRGMEMVVHHPLGTGTSAMTPAMQISAKTGTAETGGEDHAWFAGYAPARSPRIAFTVVLEHGGSGGEAAGPIVRELMTELLGLGYLRPQWDGTDG